MSSVIGQFKLTTLLVSFGLRQNEMEAKGSIRNGVVKVNGNRVQDPNKSFPLVVINEIECGKHKVVVNKSF